MSGFICIGDGTFINLREAKKIYKTGQKSRWGTPEWHAVFDWDDRNHTEFAEPDDFVARALADVIPAEPGSHLIEIHYFLNEEGKEDPIIHTYQIVAWLLRPDYSKPQPVTPDGYHENYGDDTMVLISLPDGKLKPLTSDVISYDNLADAVTSHLRDRREAAAARSTPEPEMASD
jgi:hypothetical protein